MKNDNIIRPIESLSNKIIMLRSQPVLLDTEVAKLYGVETRAINQAVKNNPKKFPEGYIIHPDFQEVAYLKSNFLISSGTHGGNRSTPTIFTERGLYMLATILKGERAIEASLEIIETFAQVHELQRNLVAMHREKDPNKQKTLMSRFSELISDIVLPDLRADETETSLELNFIIGKLKHTVKRKRTHDSPDIVEEPEAEYGDDVDD